MLAVTTLLNLSWPARIGLFVLVVVVGLGYMLWRHRGEIAAAGATSGSAVPAHVDPVAPATGAGGLPQDASAPPTPQDRPTPSPEENPS